MKHWLYLLYAVCWQHIVSFNPRNKFDSLRLSVVLLAGKPIRNVKRHRHWTQFVQSNKTWSRSKPGPWSFSQLQSVHQRCL